MPAFVSEMWRLVRPGGRLAITTWGPGWLEPASSIFWQSVREVRPELHRAFNPWDEITTPDALAALLADGGVTATEPAPVTVPVAGRQPIDGPEDFWEIVLGSGLRATVDALDDGRERPSGEPCSTPCVVIGSPTSASTRSSRSPPDHLPERSLNPWCQPVLVRG